MSYMVAIDTETTGVDFYHGAMPFFVSMCDNEGPIDHYQWDVDPETRRVLVNKKQVKELRELIHDADVLAFQNAKFDVSAFATIGINDFPWDKVHDSLILDHILRSNAPHDLTSISRRYLGTNISKYEKNLGVACNKARSVARREFPHWRICKDGDPTIPSAAGEKWRFDYWLPRTVAMYLEYKESHPWWNVLEEYANVDPVCTYRAVEKMLKLVQDNNLWEVYIGGRKKLPEICYNMQRRGLTLSKKRLKQREEMFTEQLRYNSSICEKVAKSYGHDLELPKGSRNNNLTKFCFDVMKLTPIYPKKKKTKSGKPPGPTLDSDTAIPYYLETLNPKSRQYLFIKHFAKKNEAGTALAFMKAYRRYWILTDNPDFCVLHSQINPATSKTTRFTSKNPSQQNVSKKKEFNLRYTFGPAPGREWYSADAKNIELRIPAYIAGEESLIALFEKPDEPPYYGSEHLLNFETIYPDIWNGELGKICNDTGCCNGRRIDLDLIGPHIKNIFDDTWYQWCKNGDFAIQYGAIDRPGGTADAAFHKPGAHSLLKSRFAKKEKLNRSCILQAKKHGFVETALDTSLGAKRGYPLYCGVNDWGKVKETIPLSYFVQGTAMFWMCMAMIRVYEFFEKLNRGEKFAGRKWGGGYFITMQVHDELVLDMPNPTSNKRYNLPIITEVKRLMELGGEGISVPTPVGVKYHVNNWAEGESVEFEPQLLVGV